MEKFLLFHTRYKDIQLGYFEQQNLMAVHTIESIKVSKKLLLTVDMLFRDFNISLEDISFLAAHVGPSPYTTLRVVLATLNGINFSLGVPLLEINGLEAFLKHLSTKSTNIILLNAFGHDLYYGISDINQKISIGCKNVDLLLNEIACSISGDINFYGNGAALYRDKIQEILGPRAIIPGPIPNNYDTEIVPIEFLGEEAFRLWQEKQTQQELFPVYLK